MSIQLSWWDKLRGIKGYTLQIKTEDAGWVPLHPNRDGSPYLMSEKIAEFTLQDLTIVEGAEVRIHPVK